MKNQYFDIEKAIKASKIPEDIFQSIKTEAKAEFQNDPMMYELHVLRAIKSRFWEKNHRAVRKRELAIV
jgi:hypothetical protein